MEKEEFTGDLRAEDTQKETLVLKDLKDDGVESDVGQGKGAENQKVREENGNDKDSVVAGNVLDLVDEYLLFRNHSNAQLRSAFFDLTIAKKSQPISPFYPKSLKGDPLYWFSGFPCKGLRDAQQGFKSALDDIREMAVIAAKIDELL